ncbi:Asparagine-rich zinc finger protein AZF1 [Nakaseomyces bracarensis]|uniref:Asparagine-rich zinc finger protein AZF1 n=1 Tax=Nakaseomyces bracarensis TaxID=273131 RepID=A0ABR4NUS8_9SACH
MSEHPESGDFYPSTSNNLEVRQLDIPSYRARNQMYYNQQQPYLNQLGNNNIYPNNNPANGNTTNSFAKLDDPNSNIFGFDNTLNQNTGFNPVANKNVRSNFVNMQSDPMMPYYSQKPTNSMSQGMVGTNNGQMYYQQPPPTAQQTNQQPPAPNTQPQPSTQPQPQMPPQQMQQTYRNYNGNVATGYENLMNPLVPNSVNNDRNFYGGNNSTTVFPSYGFINNNNNNSNQRRSSYTFDQPPEFNQDNKKYRAGVTAEPLNVGSNITTSNNSNNYIFKENNYPAEQINTEYFDGNQIYGQNAKVYPDGPNLTTSNGGPNSVIDQNQPAISSGSKKSQDRPKKSSIPKSQPAANPQMMPTANDLNRVSVSDPNENSSPKIGATSIDKLMLIIEARQKGFMGKVPTTQDGDLLIEDEKSKNILVPNASQLVGGVPKPEGRYTKHIKPDDPQGNSKPKRKRPKIKRYQCAYCNKLFAQSTHLDVHIKAHMGYKPYECDFCGKRFTQAGNLRTHRRSHTGERPFKCDKCEKTFTRRGNLSAHVLTHEAVKPYVCKLDNCFKSFTQLGNMKSHQNKYHPQKIKELTAKLATLDPDPSKNNISNVEMELLTYFASLYKYSNKGIKGRGKTAPN